MNSTHRLARLNLAHLEDKPEQLEKELLARTAESDQVQDLWQAVKTQALNDMREYPEHKEEIWERAKQYFRDQLEERGLSYEEENETT